MIKNQIEWDDWVKNNTDPYGKACVDVAREAMKILDENKDFDCHALICDAEKNAGEDGITGFMAGCVAQMIFQCHDRGEEFKMKWNKFYGAKEDIEGVVNPAILIIKDD